MIRALLIISGFCMLLGACTQRVICPAFQSAYIYDKESLRKKFSYFQEDSTPKILTASKNKYLIAEAVPYRKKIASISTIVMKDINPVVPDSLTMDAEVSLEDLDRAARSVIDSIYIEDVDRDPPQVADVDSVYVITKDKEVRVLRFKKDSIQYAIDEVRYNVDQDNYMWYLRDFLVLPDVRLAQLQQDGTKETRAGRRGKGERKGFFRNLFKKKAKEQADTTDAEPPKERSEFDFDYVEGEDQARSEADSQPPPKKGLFSFLKKNKEPTPARKKKEKKRAAPAEEEPEEEVEEEVDDGFF